MAGLFRRQVDSSGFPTFSNNAILLSKDLPESPYLKK